MNIDLRRGADGDINQLTVDHVSCDPVSVQRLAARSGMNDDPGRPSSRRVSDIGPVIGDVVAGHQVTGEDGAGFMRVHRHPRLPISGDPVADYNIVVGLRLHGRENRWSGRGEKPNTGAVPRDGEPVFGNIIARDSVAKHTIGHDRARDAIGDRRTEEQSRRRWRCDASVIPQS